MARDLTYLYTVAVSKYRLGTGPAVVPSLVDNPPSGIPQKREQNLIPSFYHELPAAG